MSGYFIPTDFDNDSASFVVPREKTMVRLRVRSGCLTCRKRKVKCDEHRPSCHNCERLSRLCIYSEAIRHRRFSTSNSRPSHQVEKIARQNPTVSHLDNIRNSGSITETSLPDSNFESVIDPMTEPTTGGELEHDLTDANAHFEAGNSGDIVLHCIDSFDSERDLTRMDLSFELGATCIVPSTTSGQAQSSSFAYFLENVEPVFIAPYDMLNWIRVRSYIAEMGSNNSVVAAAISCVEALYDAEKRGQDTANSISLYYIAKTHYTMMLEDELQDLETTLVVTFLLTCFEVTAQQETVSIMMKGEGAFVRRFELLVQQRPWTPVASRIEVWLKLLHAKALRLGGRGLLSAKVNKLLSVEMVPTPGLSHLNCALEAVDILYDSLTAPLFEFYVQTQLVGMQVSGMNRHHRSRCSPEDELDADCVAQHIRKNLRSVWQQRPSILSVSHVDLRGRFTDAQVNDLCSLIDICNAAYFAEVVHLGRAHGEFLALTSEGLEATRQIRTIVDNSWSRTNLVDPGLMSSIFLYGLEAAGDGGSWAVQRVRQINNPLCRSNFAADLLDGVVQEQRKTGHRVDCRYFCMDKFGVSPPFL
ncbi:hypothetical protein V1525DRAFT_147409 [Lipomyces kononenkoae]|uniref:Uncharacterized protein n=1 Tax=Lipomyces kononenkoae TaxID=34357 RepID=A0ACC3T1E4_LIPKO